MRSAGDQLTLLPATASSCSREDSLTCQAQSGCRMWPAADNIIGTFNQKNRYQHWIEWNRYVDKDKGKWVLYNFILQNYYVQCFPTDDRWSKPKDILPSIPPIFRYLLIYSCCEIYPPFLQLGPCLHFLATFGPGAADVCSVPLPRQLQWNVITLVTAALQHCRPSHTWPLLTPASVKWTYCKAPSNF